jgi:PAX-interacting protein 1
LKLNVDTEEHYRTASKMLNEAQFIWSTYENKQTRPIRATVKLLHNSCTPKQIVQELRRKGYQILDQVNILKWKTKEPLPVFMLTFDRTENTQKIYEITDIRGMRVEPTPYRNTKLLPQCKNCQSWGHTKSYCHKEIRCVKCAGKHTTINCAKPKETPPKCYNCGENHPANYRGCVVANELQALRNKATNKMKLLTQQGKPVAPTRNEQMPTQSVAGEAPTYADVVKAHPSQ